MIKTLMLAEIGEASELVKASAHPARLKVMAMLADGPREFAALQGEVGLSKTALSNHINQMVRMGMVERRGRGSYALSDDGRELLGAISGFYAGSTARERDEAKRRTKRYARMAAESRLVSGEPKYQSCWLSYTGAMAGALTSMGRKVDVVDVAGYSGYAFALNVFKGRPCPSGPTALKCAFAEIHKGTESLGFKLRFIGSEGSFGKGDGPLSAEDHERARKLFEGVKREVDADRPVVLWGLVVPEYGIVKGYKGDSYVVSTFRSVIGQDDASIKYDDLEAPGCLDALAFSKKPEPMTAKGDRDALARAIRIGAGELETHKGYANGPQAYEEWAKGLESPQAEGAYHGNSYVAACYREGRANASTFLGRLARKRAGRPQAAHLKKASAEYAKAAALLGALEEMFPFAMQGEMPEAKRRKGAALLRSARPHEEAAIGHMRKALAAWR